MVGKLKKGRVIGGRFKSRILKLPDSKNIRPTSDSVKQRIFDVLNNSFYINWSDTIFFDLFAGSGAVGIEAISCGAKQVVFVDQDELAIRCILENLRNLNVNAKIIKSKIENVQDSKILDLCQNHKTAIFFLDPPYQNIDLLNNQVSQLKKIFQNRNFEVFVIIETDSNLNFENKIHGFTKGDKQISFLNISIQTMNINKG